MTNFPFLSLLLLIPFLGAMATALVPEKQWRHVALGSALLTLAIALLILLNFDSANGHFQFLQRHTWIESLNIQYAVGIDGLSVLFLPLTALLFIAVMLASWRMIRLLPRLYYALLLLLEGTVLGVFCALDGILFFLFWELSLVPFYLLISLWGVGAERRYAALKYTLFMLVGGFPLLFGFVLLALNQADGMSFFYLDWLETAHDFPAQNLLFFLLLIGFGVKTPLFPAHTWLPIIAQESLPAIVALIVGLKLGAYGLLRFVVPLAPQAIQEFQWLLLGLGMMGLLYGAFAALSQTNLRRMLAFSSISHVGLVVIGIASLSVQGIQGAVFQLLNFTLIASALFLLTGFLQHRIGSTDVLSLGGVAKRMPLLAAFFFFFGIASLGMPGTSGFPAEFLLIVSAFKAHIGAGLVALFVVVLGAAYFLSLYRRSFLGEVRHEAIEDAVDLNRRERLIVFVFAGLVLFWGLAPQTILNISAQASEVWVGLLAFK